MENAWEDARLAEATAALAARRERSPLPERPASRGARSAEWFLARAFAFARVEEPIRVRFEPPSREIPAHLKSAMMECQKPFHLWNVTRVVDVTAIGFERVPPYKVGAAASASEEDREGRP